MSSRCLFKIQFDVSAQSGIQGLRVYRPQIPKCRYMPQIAWDLPFPGWLETGYVILSWMLLTQTLLHVQADQQSKAEDPCFRDAVVFKVFTIHISRTYIYMCFVCISRT